MLLGRLGQWLVLLLLAAPRPRMQVDDVRMAVSSATKCALPAWQVRPQHGALWGWRRLDQRPGGVRGGMGRVRVDAG